MAPGLLEARPTLLFRTADLNLWIYLLGWSRLGAGSGSRIIFLLLYVPRRRFAVRRRGLAIISLGLGLRRRPQLRLIRPRLRPRTLLGKQQVLVLRELWHLWRLMDWLVPMRVLISIIQVSPSKRIPQPALGLVPVTFYPCSKAETATTALEMVIWVLNRLDLASLPPIRLLGYPRCSKDQTHSLEMLLGQPRLLQSLMMDRSPRRLWHVKSLEVLVLVAILARILT